MDRPSDTDLAWSAGIIDGEGCIRLMRHKSKKSLTAVVHVINTDARILVKLRDMFGGTVSATPRESDNYLPAWRWQVNAAHARSVARAVLPFLVAKRDQAAALLAYEGLLRRRGGRVADSKREAVNAPLWEGQLSIAAELSHLKKHPASMDALGEVLGRKETAVVPLREVA